jgi:superfamily II DNA or RNA helicase
MSESQKGPYLGVKGYSLYKDELSVKEQRFIRDSLSVRPYIPKSPVQPPKFPIFRESPLKLYVPRYWGIEHFGPPITSKLDEPERISIKFGGDLRDYQEAIVNSYLSHVSKPHIQGGLLEVPCGRGKTCCGLYIAAKLGFKTLVVVHKEFLLNQWVERIQQFLPNTRIGRLQGQILDIDNKDIVIAMLQSLSMKDYPQNMFVSFGLTIVDEVHHISSEVFSRALSRVVTKYTLGLSATMQRKDGLTNVFKMFLGEIAYSEKAEPNQSVLVKAVTYSTDDSEHNNVELDYRGNPKYSTMISKLCNFNPRTEFIINIIKQELDELEGQQIMILAHQKAILVYLHDAINHRNIASVGYYIGGMKEAELKKSENKQIILATYAMASEGLDIKTLTTLIMATPKTDITQSVGRILRVKHSRPLIVDVVDEHEPFQRQWAKRRQWYNQNKYHVMHTDHIRYASKDWKDLTVTVKSKREAKEKTKVSSGCLLDLSKFT